MPTTNNIPITPGTGANVATFQVNRDSVTENVQAMSIVDSSTAVPVNVLADGSMQLTLADIAVVIKQVLNQIESPAFLEPTTGRIMVTLDAIRGALTLATVTTVGTVTTVSTVTNQSSWGGLDIKQIQAFEQETQSWALTVRGRIN